MAGRDHPPVAGWTPPSARQRYEIVRSSRTVAMVGVSSDRARPSHFVATYLLAHPQHFELYFVNPGEREILGRPTFPSLADLPVTPDLVDVFRRSEQLPAIAREVAAIGAKTLWIQLGLWSPAAAQIAVAAGCQAVMDRCLKIEHARFYGGLHLAGFDTGEIRSKRARH